MIHIDQRDDAALNVEVTVQNRTNTGAGHHSIRSVKPLIEYVLREEAARGDWEVAIVLVNDAELQSLHLQFIGLDTPTDVMTFPYGDEGTWIEVGSVRGGEIIISVDRAEEQGPDYEHSVEDELRYLIIHGVLHLVGWNDANDADRAAMLERGNVLLQSFPHELSTS